ncbi:MAG: metallophosphoesterase [Clostridia bacterium]|nr:metallophosphoesterase [Clostridia bacterium]
MLYFTGDTHGDAERLSKNSLKKLQNGDTLIICGDFGFIWDGSAREQKLLDRLEKFRFNVCFIDGTHENFELLDKYPGVIFCGGKARRIRKNVFYLMRGQIFEIEGRSVFTLGGGEAPESAMRSDEELDIKRPEVPSKQDMLTGVENLQEYGYTVDFIATHEPPAKIRDFLAPPQSGFAEVTALGAFLDELMKTARFKKWFFGSLHTDKYISQSFTGVFTDLVPASVEE